MEPEGFRYTDEDGEVTITWVPRNASPTMSLPEQIAEQLGRAIVSGHFRPGQRIQEQNLASRFEVSRGPVREALRILENDGLVQILPRRGAQITRLSEKEVNDLFVITASLFGLAARLVALDGAKEATARMIKEAEHMAHLLDQGIDPERYLARVYQLYLYVADTAGNARLKAMLASLARQILRYSRVSLMSHQRRMQSARNWRRLAQAMDDGRPADADETARRLVDDARRVALEAGPLPDEER